ncbi:hypothetical protein ACROYT_G014933 [Oculina patagonica]
MQKTRTCLPLDEAKEFFIPRTSVSKCKCGDVLGCKFDEALLFAGEKGKKQLEEHSKKAIICDLGVGKVKDMTMITKQGARLPFTWMGYPSYTRLTPWIRPTPHMAEFGASEGLKQGCFTKGSKAGTGGKLVKMIVVISYNKSVIICQQYHRMCGAFFEGFIDEHFESMFQTAGRGKSRTFPMDGDPSQNSARAKAAMSRVGCQLFKIPPRSPELNGCENVGKGPLRRSPTSNFTIECEKLLKRYP